MIDHSLSYIDLTRLEYTCFEVHIHVSVPISECCCAQLASNCTFSFQVSRSRLRKFSYIRVTIL